MFKLIKKAFKYENKYKKNIFDFTSCEPFPNVQIENYLTKNRIDEILINWPKKGVIPPQAEGDKYKILNLLRIDHQPLLESGTKKFWENFIKNDAKKIIDDLLSAYQPWIISKFKDCIDNYKLELVGLTEIEDGDDGVGIHIHSHNPNWLFTALIYIDDGENLDHETRGTALWKYPSTADHILKKLSETCPNEPPNGFELALNCHFKAGKLFSFFETPISLHGSIRNNKTENQHQEFSRRKIIRIHVAANEEITQKLYGISQSEYKKLQYPQSEIFDQRVLDWYRYDMSSLVEGNILFNSCIEAGQKSLDIVNKLKYKEPLYT